MPAYQYCNVANVVNNKSALMVAILFNKAMKQCTLNHTNTLFKFIKVTR